MQTKRDTKRDRAGDVAVAAADVKAILVLGAAAVIGLLVAGLSVLRGIF